MKEERERESERERERESERERERAREYKFYVCGVLLDIKIQIAFYFLHLSCYLLRSILVILLPVSNSL